AQDRATPASYRTGERLHSPPWSRAAAGAERPGSAARPAPESYESGEATSRAGSVTAEGSASAECCCLYCAAGQIPGQFLDACLGDLRRVQVQVLKSVAPPQVDEPLVSDLSAEQFQPTEAGELGERLEPLVGDPRLAQPQPL